ncbi:cyclodeaminase/cyclohydrolase family protein [Allostreptomyces psammosilenae]|uniref:Formiminotetrahydrofolate cyclodeaminase n=1 Tax=Allostreptomyces psammosilenae TaxID=1892865 RepID=A0A853A742_9ACTN|nr:cyclodeaminase/cyclohydrolase family protein [Allostreptomyces psammosilenae]NYI06491.1 formiminotetrahydrofolate cyclodeaminase [Allostreptomyces psammosilenae]
MRSTTIDDYLDQLAARVPAPGGGAAAALHAAQGAALLAMVARYSDGERYARDRPAIEKVREDSDALRATAVELAERDAAAFTLVTDAYRLPKGTEEERAARGRAIADALLGAARPPAAVIDVCQDLVTLAEELLPLCNRSVVTDVAAAAEAVRAAATTARVNVEVNLAGIDAELRAPFVAAVSSVDDLTRRTDRVTAAVREEITR